MRFSIYRVAIRIGGLMTVREGGEKDGSFALMKSGKVLL